MSTQLSSTVQRVATYLQIVVLLAVLVIVILESLGTLKPHFEFATVGEIVGLTLCGLGAILTMVSQYQMGESWRIGVDETETTELVTHGMFSYSRNPIYCGMLVVGLGFLVLVPHTFTAMCFILAFIGIDLQVRKIEEPHLEKVFGEEYDEYTRRINRYIPGVPKS
ncbi:MAG: isoprenylcysteine carboxylmethyltransferase family protein [Gammaproteobacteria bacterium]|nr:isoprenylcysteine carboxylmethyltransferase family protein [Gammaproteobacteria bacterium]